jgi:hypothetical protein
MRPACVGGHIVDADGRVLAQRIKASALIGPGLDLVEFGDLARGSAPRRRRVT